MGPPLAGGGPTAEDNPDAVSYPPPLAHHNPPLRPAHKIIIYSNYILMPRTRRQIFGNVPLTPRRRAPTIEARAGLNKIEKKQVKQLVRGQSETKRFVTAVGISSVDFSGGISGNLSAISQGDGYNQREGDIVTLSKAVLRLTITSGPTTNAFRVIIFRWLEDSVTVPTVADLLLPGYAGTADAPRAPLVFGALREKFNVLHDKLYGLAYNSRDIIQITKNIYFKNSKVRYSPGITSGRSNIFMLQISDDGISTYPTSAWTWELYYKDV